MAKKIYYQKTVTMEPRDGVKYATTYYKQTLDQRKALTNHIRDCMREMADYLDSNPEDYHWATTTPLRGFPKTRGSNRTMWEIMEDMAGEAMGRQRSGLPKDYAQAPIERWNKLFADTDYEFTMRQGSAAAQAFNKIFEIEQDA